MYGHLFFQCTYAARIWSALKRKIHAYGIPVEWNDLIESMATQFQNNSIKSVISKIVLGAGVYFI